MKIYTFLILAFIACFTTAVFAQEVHSTSIVLDHFTVKPHGISTAVVADASGPVFGVVQSLATDKSGRPRTLTVQMPGGRLLQIDAARASYDFATHRVTADVTANGAIVLRTAQGPESPKS